MTWSKTITAFLGGGEKVDAAVILIGSNDRQPIREGGEDARTAFRCLEGGLYQAGRCHPCLVQGQGHPDHLGRRAADAQR